MNLENVLKIMKFVVIEVIPFGNTIVETVKRWKKKVK